MTYHKTYSTGEDGCRLLFFGAIHGNEHCGSFAIHKIMDEIDSGTLPLLRGSVTFVPVANEEAALKDVRYIHRDLNRSFVKTKNPQDSEERAANELCALVDDHDTLIDLHSMRANGKASVFLDFPTEANRALAGEVGVSFAIIGWNELYDKEKTPSHDTMTYAASEGKDGVLVECGQNYEPASVEVAYRAIRGVLAHYGMAKPEDGWRRKIKPREVLMTHFFKKESKKDVLNTDAWHLDEVKKGTVLATRADRSEIVAVADSLVLLPKEDAKAGEEWFYLGVTDRFLVN